MPQSFHVLRCCRCDVFQVQQVKKVKKWACKMCGEKQSVLRVYGEGTGLECRKHVQKLNMMQGEKEALIGLYQQQEEFTVDIPQPAANNEFQSAPLGTKWAQFVESEEEDEGEGNENTQIPCTTDRNAFEQANRESRKMRRKAFQGRYETPTPYERPSTMKTPQPKFSSNSVKPFASKSSPYDSVTSSLSSSPASIGYNALTKNKFQMPLKSTRPQQKSTDSYTEANRPTTWNRGNTVNVGSEVEDKRGNFNRTHSTQLSASGEASTIGSQSKWSKFSNLQTENDRLQSHNAPKFQPSPEHNVPTSDAKSKWNRFGIIENCEESDARSSLEPSNNLAGSRNSATLFKPSTSSLIQTSNPTIPKNIKEHNVPSFSGSNHNVPQTKTFNAAGPKSTEFGKSEVDSKPDSGSKWGRFLMDETNENEEEEEEEEEVEEDVNEEGQIMVEFDGIRTDEVKHSEQRNVFYTEQNFELELEDW